MKQEIIRDNIQHDITIKTSSDTDSIVEGIKYINRCDCYGKIQLEYFDMFMPDDLFIRAMPLNGF